MNEKFVNKTFTVLNTSFPVVMRIYETRVPSLYLAEAFVKLGEKKHYLRLSSNNTKGMIAQFKIKKLDEADSNYRWFRDFVAMAVEDKLTRWEDKKRKSAARGEVLDTIDEDIDFVFWQLRKIRETGDVEQGAEASLRTEAGKEMLKKSPVSDRLKKEMKVYKDHIIDAGLSKEVH